MPKRDRNLQPLLKPSDPMKVDSEVFWEWSLRDLSSSMHMDEDSIRKHFRDGRNSSSMMIWRAADIFGMEILPSNHKCNLKRYDDLWSVVMLTSGVSFAPSKMKGTGRKFDKFDWEFNLRKVISGFIVVDIATFPKVTFYKIKSQEILNFYEAFNKTSFTRAMFRSVLQKVKS